MRVTIEWRRGVSFDGYRAPGRLEVAVSTPCRDWAALGVQTVEEAEAAGHLDAWVRRGHVSLPSLVVPQPEGADERVYRLDGEQLTHVSTSRVRRAEWIFRFQSVTHVGQIRGVIHVHAWHEPITSEWQWGISVFQRTGERPMDPSTFFWAESSLPDYQPLNLSGYEPVPRYERTEVV